MIKPKTVLIDETTHRMLKNYCKRIGTKVQAVADKAIQAYLRKVAK
jgi:hypothetical protein